ncbi:MAG: hypothetical protein QW279_14055 [Candidatus Jordarchaeaceae archaeon]
MPWIIDKPIITKDGIAEDTSIKSYKRALIIMRISIPEVNGTQRLSKSENLQLLTSIDGVISEYVPKKKIKKNIGGCWTLCDELVLMAVRANKTIAYKRITANRLPSRIIRITSFLIKKLSKDLDSRFNVRIELVLENILILLSIFNVCTRIDVSNGEANGTYVAAGKKFLLEANIKNVVDSKKKEVRPKISIKLTSTPYIILTRISAKNVEG